ncbi:MAG: hypothetical protein FWD57_07110 [Polyangiaceae bacterium]|nr:hypothetical protein [Polyangiaceae bacterium]
MIVDPAVASKIIASISRRDGLGWFGGSWSAVCIVGHRVVGGGTLVGGRELWRMGASGMWLSGGDSAS